MSLTLTLDRLKSVLSYDPESGEFRRIGEVNRAGRLHVHGYRDLMVDGVRYKEHRLAWFYMTGKWPLFDLDHINCVKNDNRFANLREASRTQNRWNTPRRRDNTSGATGVTYHRKMRKWQARVVVRGRITHLGSFDSVEEAASARRAAAAGAYEGFARD